MDASTLLEPIGTLLALLEAGLGNLAAGVIALVPTCAAKARDELKDLDKALSEAVSAFTIHPPNTPIILPLNATNEPLNATNEPLNTITQPLNATNEPLNTTTQPHHAPLPGVVGSPVSGPGGPVSKPTEISATGPIGTPVVVPFQGQ